MDREAEEVIHRIRALRRSGAVKRCHTIPALGEYSVASHSFGVVCLLLELHRQQGVLVSPSPELLRCALLHDAAEAALGDLPAPALWGNHALEQAYLAAEQSILLSLGVDLGGLTTEERAWLDGCDKLELLFWAVEQQELGNRTANKVERALCDWLTKNWKRLPTPVRELFVELESEREK